MIPADLRILVATQPIDMRRSIDGLVAAIMERFKHAAAKERIVYVFSNPKKDRAKMVWRTARQRPRAGARRHRLHQPLYDAHRASLDIDGVADKDKRAAAARPIPAKILRRTRRELRLV